jgi:hypothetical protein
MEEELTVYCLHMVNYVLMWMCDIFSRGHGIAYKYVSIAVVSIMTLASWTVRTTLASYFVP